MYFYFYFNIKPTFHFGIRVLFNDFDFVFLNILAVLQIFDTGPNLEATHARV